MANNQLAIRFTEEMYATKNEVSRELHMSLIDNIWSEILKYRSTYYRYLSLKSIEKNQLMICLCQTVGNNIQKMDNRLFALREDYLNLNRDNGDVERFEDLCYIKSLQYLAKKYNIETSDIYLRSLVQGDVHELHPEKIILRKYLASLRFIKENHSEPVTIDYLADLYSVFTENPELTSFYRDTEDRNPNNRVLIDRRYTAAPVALIEGLMNSLFTFINTSTLQASAKAIIAYYFINYVRPFPKENEEIALLVMKAILSSEKIDEFAGLIPLENLLLLNQDAFNKICVEVQKTNDLTYFVNYILKEMNPSLGDIANIKANQAADIYRRDVYLEDKEEKAIPTYVAEKEEVKVEPVIEKPLPEVKKEEPQPKKVEAKPEEPKQEESHEIAFRFIPKGLDEKEAQRLEEHLLEMDPSIKKGEAKFYARHCTMHMNYTIQQYKRAIGCAYETARTSMEHLVELHYYRKDKIKNKFVYTPIKQQ